MQYTKLCFSLILLCLLFASCTTKAVKKEPTRTLRIFDEDIEIHADSATLREMTPVETSHWVAMIYSMEKQLDVGMKHGSFDEERLFKKKRRINSLVESAIGYYKSFPTDLSIDLNKLLGRIDRYIVKLREPHIASVMEVPIYGDEVTKKRIIRPFQFIWPVTKIKVTSQFGPRRDPFTYKQGFHDGIDLGGKTGELVYAAERGRVIFTGWKGRAGKLVIIEHKFGYQTFYAHLHEILTVRGLIVERGQPVGLLGSTGRSTGPHVHFKISERGKSVDPAKYVGAELE